MARQSGRLSVPRHTLLAPRCLVLPVLPPPGVFCGLGALVQAVRGVSSGGHIKEKRDPTAPKLRVVSGVHDVIARALGCPERLVGVRSAVHLWPHAGDQHSPAIFDRRNGARSPVKTSLRQLPRGLVPRILRGLPRGEFAGRRDARAAGGLTGATGLGPSYIPEPLGAAVRGGSAARVPKRRRSENADVSPGGSILAGVPARPCECKAQAEIIAEHELATTHSGALDDSGSGVAPPGGCGEGE